MMRHAHFTLLATLILAATGCQTRNVQRAEGFSPVATRRVAVLPFVASYSGRNLPTEFFDDIPVIGSGRNITGEEYLRRQFIARLRRGAYDIVEPAYVDTRLAHAGLYENAAFRDTPVQDLGRLLSVDAVVIGDVTEWDIEYYVVETRHDVRVDLQMIDALTGEVLVDVEATATEGAGLSGGPTGIGAAAGEPLRGLSAVKLFTLGRKVSDDLAQPFLPTELEMEQAKSESPDLLFATHDQPAGKPLETNEILTVLAQGAAGMQAEWRLEAMGLGGSMIEVEPGFYVGKLRVVESLEFEGDIVTVELANDRGFRSAQTVSHKPLRTASTDD